MYRISVVLIAMVLLAGCGESGYEKEVEVSNIDELIEALDSDTKITLKTGKYNISEARGYNQPGLMLEEMFNLAIIAPDGAEILIDDQISNVVVVNESRDIVFEGITMGHTEMTFCYAPVISVNHSKDVKLQDCDLFGCGEIGVVSIKSRNVTFDNTIIRDCSQQVASIQDGKNISFLNCEIKNSGTNAGIEVMGVSDTVRFKDCTIDGITTYERDPIIKVGTDAANVLIEGCTFTNNKGYSLYTTGTNVKALDNESSNNELVSE